MALSDRLRRVLGRRAAADLEQALGGFMPDYANRIDVYVPDAIYNGVADGASAEETITPQQTPCLVSVYAELGGPTGGSIGLSVNDVFVSSVTYRGPDGFEQTLLAVVPAGGTYAVSVQGHGAGGTADVADIWEYPAL